MALLELRFPSQILGREVGMNLLVPDTGNGPFPTLYLLHGMYDDYTGWLRRSKIEIYVRDLPMVVVMPDGQRSFYANANNGPRFHDHIVHEVISQTERLLPVKKTRAGRAVGGLSMGGYGAIRLALTHPDEFVSAHSHSGALMRGTYGWREKGNVEFQAILGKNPAGSPHDLVALAKHALAHYDGPMPRILIDCGTEDELCIGDNREFHQALTALKINHEYREFPGIHDWYYWDEHIREAIDFHAAALRLKRPR